MTSFMLSKPYPRLWSLDAGVAMAVTDLHGDWDAYQRYADALLADQDVDSLRRAFAKLSQAQSYDALARYYLAVIGADDPRYNDLLRGFLASTSTDFGHLYEALFTSCEREYGPAQYSAMLAGTLQQLSIGYAQQRVLVAGHMVTNNGYTVIADRHLRLASGCHARPRERRAYLLFDAARPVEQATDLLADLFDVYHS